jgi:hypothetical protein
MYFSVVHLTTLPLAQTTIESNDRVINELGRVWKETIVALFNVLYQHMPWRDSGKPKNLRQDSRSPGRDLNPGLPQYDTGVLITQLRRSVELWWYKGQKNYFGIYFPIHNLTGLRVFAPFIFSSNGRFCVVTSTPSRSIRIQSYISWHLA